MHSEGSAEPGSELAGQGTQEVEPVLLALTVLPAHGEHSRDLSEALNLPAGQRLQPGEALLDCCIRGLSSAVAFEGRTAAVEASPGLQATHCKDDPSPRVPYPSAQRHVAAPESLLESAGHALHALWSTKPEKAFLGQAMQVELDLYLPGSHRQEAAPPYARELTGQAKQAVAPLLGAYV